MKYKKVAIAGTFDRLHRGHKHFISEAFKLGNRVLIGLTSDEYVRNKLKTQNSKLKTNVKNYEERKSELLEFLREKNVQERAEVVRINDVYGPTKKKVKTQKSKVKIEALLVTKDSLAGGIEVNKKRKELGLPELKIIEIPLIRAEDNERISSTRIRLGEIDRFGKLYFRSKLFGIKISNSLRQNLKKPLGDLITGTADKIESEVRLCIRKNNPPMLVAVGDEATKYFNRLGRPADIAIVDFHIKRIRVHKSIRELEFPEEFYGANYKNKIISAENPPGFITKDLAKATETAFREFVKDGKRRAVIVEGEEDLAGIPAILLAPLGTLVFYGQPDKGIVAVSATEEKKREILDFQLDSRF